VTVSPLLTAEVSDTHQSSKHFHVPVASVLEGAVALTPTSATA